MAKRSFATQGLAAAALLLASGCSGVVEIITPPDGNASGGGYNVSTAPVSQFVVKINSNYVSSFSADLDGAPVTGWSPAPAANTTVTALAPACFSGGKSIAASNLYVHELIARATSTSPSASIDNDIADFVPPSMQFSQTSFNLTRGQTVSVGMNLTTPQPVVTVVTLKPNHTNVSVNAAPAGATATGTIPNNNIGAFTITGLSSGSFIINASVRGVQCGGVSGYVQ